MNIGMIVFSHTGNTLSVAAKLQEKLASAGHSVTLERLEVVGGYDPQSPGQIEFEALPQLEAYDALVLGAPVQAFSLSPVMATYLKQAPSLENKKAACLVTQAFPFAWLGGNRAVRQMEKACRSKGATICGSGVVNWMKPSREQQIAEVTDRLSEVF